MPQSAARWLAAAAALTILMLVVGCTSHASPPSPAHAVTSAPARALPAIRVAAVSQMATSAVRLSERVGSFGGHTLAPSGQHYVDITLLVPADYNTPGNPAPMGAPYVIVDGKRVSRIDVSITRTPPDASDVRMTNEFAVPATATVASIRIPFGKPMSGEIQLRVR